MLSGFGIPDPSDIRSVTATAAGTSSASINGYIFG